MTTQAINAAILAVASVVRNVSGISQTFDYPPETANYSPFAVVLSMHGHLDNAAIGTRKDLFDIAIDLLLPFSVKLEDAIATLTPFLDTLPAALQAEVSTPTAGRFGNTITTFSGTDWDYMVTDYDGVPVRGYRFLMQGVKILVAT